jgi:ribonuclease VapC
MVLDTSAIVAILQDEPERRKFNEAIEAAESLENG